MLWRGDSRLSVRPTARGWQALAAGVVTLFVARLIGTTQFHQLAYALLALPLASLVLGVIGSRGLRYSRVLPLGARITAGDPAKVSLLLERSRFAAAKAGVVDRLPGPRSFEFPSPRGRLGSRIEAPLDFARRGVYELGPAEVRVADPFGLLGFARRFEQRMEVVVYPKTHDLWGFLPRGGNVDAGARGSRGRRGEEFAGLREYRRGDDRRHIHWKSVARTGELFVKEFSLQAPRRHTVVLDLRREGIRTQETEVEDAVSAAASVLAHLTRERLPVRLLSTDRDGASTQFGADEASYWETMRLLATVRADGTSPLGEALLAERGSLGEGVVIVSRTRDEELPASVRKLKETGLSVIVVAIATHTYRTPPGSGGASQSREADFLRSLARLEAAGAAVRVVSHPAGVGGLSGNREMGAVR
ncbi:MAG: DUF58 domain-containing protein [Actinomycetota bacterium]|nr:DUF58 domain-containing protein [Actinomycetota bacterium]